MADAPAREANAEMTPAGTEFVPSEDRHTRRFTGRRTEFILIQIVAPIQSTVTKKTSLFSGAMEDSMRPSSPWFFSSIDA
jgi:hypothetical protein